MAYYGITTFNNSAPSAASGTVSVTVADPSVLTAGLKATVRPQAVGVWGGVAVARRSHRVLVNSVVGSTVSLTLGQDSTLGRPIEFGDIIDQTGEALVSEVSDHETRITTLESGVPAASVDALRQFIAGIYAVCGPYVRACWMPDPTTPGTTINDMIVPGRVWTYNAHPVGGRYSVSGNGNLISFDGATQYLSTPDAGDLTFIEPQAFSIFVVANVTNTAAARTFVNKFTAAGFQREWAWTVLGSDLPQFALVDESAGPAVVLVPGTTAVQQGALTSHAVAYRGAGGANAGFDVQWYSGGIGAATTPAATGGYVAMEDHTAACMIGASDGGTANFFQGTMGLVLVVAKALTAADMQALHQYCKTYFGI